MNKVVGIFFGAMVLFGALLIVLFGLSTIALMLTFLISTLFLVTLLAIVHAKTNAFIDLSASMNKQAQIWFFGSDKRVRRVFVNGLGTNKIAEVPGVGNILVTEDSVYTDNKTGAPMAIIPGELGFTVPPKLIAASHKLIDSNVEDITYMINQDGSVKEEYADSFVKINPRYDAYDISVKGEKPVGRFLKKVTGETVRILDFLRFSKYDVTPASVELAIEKSVADQMRGQRTLQFKWVLAIVALMMAGSIAFVIIMTFAPTTAPGATAGQIQEICRATCNTVQATGGIQI